MLPAAGRDMYLLLQYGQHHSERSQADQDEVNISRRRSPGPESMLNELVSYPVWRNILIALQHGKLRLGHPVHHTAFNAELHL